MGGRGAGVRRSQTPCRRATSGRRQRLGAVMGPARGGQTRTRVCAHLRALARCAGLIQPTKACCTLSLRRQHQGRSAAFGCVMVLSTEGCRRVGERTGESKEGGCRLGTGGGFTGDAAAHGDRRSVCCGCVGFRRFEVERMFVGEFAGSFLFLQKNFSQRKRRENEPVIDLARCRRCCRRWRANQRQP